MKRSRKGLRAAVSAEQSAKYTEARAAVFKRSGGRCELCGCRLTMETLNAHHRLLRSAGGEDCTSNLLALCSRDHHQTVHAYPERARANGWIISRYDVRPPRQVPVLIGGRHQLLTRDGQRIEQTMLSL